MPETIADGRGGVTEIGLNDTRDVRAGGGRAGGYDGCWPHLKRLRNVEIAVQKARDCSRNLW
ncbi:MAG: hypothetical protein U0N15_01645 [Bifidobacterium choerinum]